MKSILKAFLTDELARMFFVAFLNETAAKQKNPDKAQVYTAIASAVAAIDLKTVSPETKKNTAKAFRAAAEVLDPSE